MEKLSCIARFETRIPECRRSRSIKSYERPSATIRRDNKRKRNSSIGRSSPKNRIMMAPGICSASWLCKSIVPIDYAAAYNFGGVALGDTQDGESVPLLTVDS